MQATMSATGKATSSQSTLSRVWSVSTNIHTKPEVIWALLTDAANMTKWNSTIISVEGNIKLGEKIALKSISDPKRTFNLKISEFNPPTKLVWGDGAAPMFKGVRTY